MLRGLVIGLVLGCATLVVGLEISGKPSDGVRSERETSPPAVISVSPKAVIINESKERASTPWLVIPEARIQPIEKVDVPAEHDGVLLVLGTQPIPDPGELH
jgi:hypothetical protein